MAHAGPISRHSSFVPDMILMLISSPDSAFTTLRTLAKFLSIPIQALCPTPSLLQPLRTLPLGVCSLFADCYPAADTF